MKTLLHGAKLVLPDQLMENGWLVIEDDMIFDYGTGETPTDGFDRTIDCNGCYLSPGFIDMHVHGASNCEFLDCTEEAIMTVLRTHLHAGTTTILPTVSSMSHERYLQFFDSFTPVYEKLPTMDDVPDVPGIHMEGPYLDGDVIGGMIKGNCRPVDLEQAELYLEKAPYIKRWTIACEYPDGMELGRRLERRGILASIGHSDATLQQVQEAFHNGYTSITHLYSSCSFYHRNGAYREGGIVEAAFLMKDIDVEMITDGCHLPKEFLQLIYGIKGPDHIALITDASRYTAIDVPEGELIRSDVPEQQPLYIENGVAVIEGGRCFAGSIALPNRLIRTITKIAGVDMVNAIRMASLTPARMLGIDTQVGSIKRGKRANLVVFDEDIEMRHVFVGGKEAAL